MDLSIFGTVKGAVCAIAFAGTAQAGVTCSFFLECYEADPCSETSFVFEFTDHAAGARLQQGVTASTDFGDLGGYTLKRDGAYARYVFEGPGAMYFLTVEGPAARLSVHTEGPGKVGYIGLCEGA